MDLIMKPWPWYIGGLLVAIVMLSLILVGKNFGFSSNFRVMCSALGAGKYSSFFNFNWKSQRWNLLFLFGSILGGFISKYALSDGQSPAISSETVAQLHDLGFYSAGNSYYPVELFDNLSTYNVILLAIGGLLIGFGTRYAGGCTSGHAISGLSDLQLPSLIAVIGFFIGGLIMTHVLFPFIF
ncbi:YeeE/YedE family protein [Sphingobacterium hungaricum]|uniref:YeeE/YedE family protein n=1 Tax=Sphingobacterium hungaricum TaxID=2082723 RepID=A0A928UXG3_9SPHI|nr:YeeE/YedE thiosulfate transporter family protein [Sphingobacterium hungaricum]MBE8714487.1 YeeE/YedE family protein [Sphingobacterium hungaricum]